MSALLQAPESPKAVSSKAEAPKAEAPKFEAPKIDMPKFELPKVDLKVGGDGVWRACVAFSCVWMTVLAHSVALGAAGQQQKPTLGAWPTERARGLSSGDLAHH